MKHDAELLNAAIEGFELQKQRIDAQIAEMRRILRPEPTAKPRNNVTEIAKPKRTVSPAARKRMAAAQKRRWAAARGITAGGELSGDHDIKSR